MCKSKSNQRGQPGGVISPAGSREGGYGHAHCRRATFFRLLRILISRQKAAS